MQIKNLKGEVILEVPGSTLEGADLSCTDLHGADLRAANLRDVNLRRAVLVGADLTGANLSYAQLGHAHLAKSKLIAAKLHTANLRCADLREADLVGADLSGADLGMTKLAGANLRFANLYAAQLTSADLSGASLPQPLTPKEGEFTGFKKVQKTRDERTCTVITLRIPAYAQRTSALVSRKCRASAVIVIDGCGFSPTFTVKQVYYAPGVEIYADRFDPDRRQECTQGIHFFMTRDEAEAYRP